MLGGASTAVGQVPDTLPGSIDLSRELLVSLGMPGLFVVAVIEFFFFPIPPMLVLIPLAVARPELAPVYALVATVGSVSAGVIGFYVGRKGGRPVLRSRFADDRVARVEAYFQRSGFVTIAIGAFAPIPEGYELLSVASGAFGFDRRSYVLASLVGRGGKYFLIATLVVVLGEAARSMSEVEIYAVTGSVTLAVIVAYLLRRRWAPRTLDALGMSRPGR